MITKIITKQTNTTPKTKRHATVFKSHFGFRGERQYSSNPAFYQSPEINYSMIMVHGGFGGDTFAVKKPVRTSSLRRGGLAGEREFIKLQLPVIPDITRKNLKFTLLHFTLKTEF